MDTIYARSTAPGRAGIAVIRLSGSRSWQAVSDITQAPLPEERTLALRKLRDGDELIDVGLVALMGEGRSFTGEESAEFHLHGSEAVVRRVLSMLGHRAGLRHAGPGEFTRRALENDCISLSEVEGLNALLLAETEAQRRQAVRIVDGVLREKVDVWRRLLVTALAALEVTVDFADEEVPEAVPSSLQEDLRSLARNLRVEGEGVRASQMISRGFEVAIVGAPNAGKSTLLNNLAGRDAALTSEVAGTTRDVIEVRMEIAGLLVTLLDTAGIRETSDELEKAGVDLARRRAQRADIRLFIDEVPDGLKAQRGDLVVLGKADLRETQTGDGLAVSGRTGLGVGRLLERLEMELSGRVAGAGVAVTERQGAALLRAAVALDDVIAMLGTQSYHVEIVSESLHRSVQALDEVVGKIGVEDVLGEIFSQFCIGK